MLRDTSNLAASEHGRARVPGAAWPRAHLVARELAELRLGARCMRCFGRHTCPQVLLVSLERARRHL
jgi:hypothetical protein